MIQTQSLKHSSIHCTLRIRSVEYFLVALRKVATHAERRSFERLWGIVTLKVERYMNMMIVTSSLLQCMLSLCGSPHMEVIVVAFLFKLMNKVVSKKLKYTYDKIDK